MKFRKMFYNFTGIDPFTTLTIASACHLVYRTNYLPKDTIAIIPPLGYCPKNKQSLFAKKGFCTLPKRTKSIFNTRATVARNLFIPYLLDDYHEETHTAYEVHGCFWHGCLRCYTHDTVNPVSGKTMQELHCCTVEKIEYLRP